MQNISVSLFIPQSTTLQWALYHQLKVDPEKHSPHNMQNLLYKIWLLEFDRLNDTIQFNHFLPKPWQACCKNSLVMPRAGLLLGRQQGQGEGRGGGRVVSERPPMLGDAIGLRSRGRGASQPVLLHINPRIFLLQIWSKIVHPNSLQKVLLTYE